MMDSKEFELTEKEIMKMRKGKKMRLNKIPVIAMTFLSLLVTATLSIVIFNGMKEMTLIVFFCIFACLSIIGIAISFIPSHFPKQWIRELNKKLYMETFETLPTNTNFPIDRRMLVDEKVYPAIINKLKADATFQYNEGVVEIYDIRKMTSTRKTDDGKSEAIEHVLLKFKSCNFDTSRIELSRSGAQFESCLTNYESDKEIIDGYEIRHDGLTDADVDFLKSDYFKNILDVLNENYGEKFLVILEKGILYVLISDATAKVNPIPYRSTKPLDMYKEKELEMARYANISRKILGLSTSKEELSLV